MRLDRQTRREVLSTPNPDLSQRLVRLRLRARQACHVPEYLLGKDLDRPIFIVGAPRSGTQLLMSAIRASRHVRTWPGEGHEVWEADYHPSLRSWDSNVLNEDDVVPEYAKRIRRRFFLNAGSRRRLLDKSPRNALKIPWVNAIFPHCRFLFMIRDGRDNVNSLINAWRSPRYRTYRLPQRHAIPGVDPSWWKFVLYPGWMEDRSGPLEVICAKQWVYSNHYGLDGGREIDRDRWMEVRYEDLVENPDEEMRRVFDFIDLPYDPKVSAKAQSLTPVNVVTPPERGKWRKENPDEINAVLPLIRPMMEKLGYAFDGG